ncbi:MAG TPA: hypothetical protein VNT81_07395 [Vicinamibacterales bacterium]|nr:hypothetical protein [Vicinamibacterales bacterium]
MKRSASKKPRPASKPAAAHVVYNTPLPKKLGIKPGFKVALLTSPKGFAATLAPLPAKVSFTARPEPEADLFMAFARSSAELQAHLLSLPRTIAKQTLWLVWPKKASGVASDLDGNVVRESGLASGWVDFKVCSVDTTWSALAFKRRK